MKINIYYGGRGLLDDPTLYVISRIENVLKELRVKVERYNIYEHKNEIATLPQTFKDVDGIILATTVEWLGIGGYMQQFLDACWLYGDKEKISNTYMQPIVMSTTYGEREAETTLCNAWEILGGLPCSGLCGYVEDITTFQLNKEYNLIIEKRAENLYRTISQRFDDKPYMTIGIIVVNIIVFVLMSISGSTLDAQYMAAHGAMYPEYIKDGQYWRLLTSMFMHFGLMHILNNMVVLGAVGQIVEKAMGHVKLLITFLVSGMCGSVLSYIVMLYNNDFAVSAGASGAIFGLVGALVWIVIANRGFYEGISRQQAVFMVILMIYYGVSTQGVDNWAHGGGLVGGFVISIVLYRKKRYNKYNIN